MTSTPVPSWLMMMTVALVVKRSENGKLKGEEMYWKFNWQTEGAGADEKGSIWWERYLFSTQKTPLLTAKHWMNDNTTNDDSTSSKEFFLSFLWCQNKSFHSQFLHWVCFRVPSTFCQTERRLSDDSDFVSHAMTCHWELFRELSHFTQLWKPSPNPISVSVVFHSKEKWIHHDDEAEGSSWTRKGRIDS